MGESIVKTFWSLIQEKRIVIPMIQRDYAQGRVNTEATRIRSDFLTSILDAISENNKLQLDFIYGIPTKNDEKDSDREDIFLPLDGQQRLTTLFLLHWYAAAMAGTIQEQLTKFSYETRESARLFCEYLAKYQPSDNEKEASEISLEIKNQKWYRSQWRYDSTITGMLTMIDAIHKHEKLNDHPQAKKDLWKKLTTENLISFTLITLKNEFGSPDSLYIKMNARGKPLTNFEHFKALFIEDYIKTKSSEDFLDNMHDSWMDIFWRYQEPSAEQADSMFLNYIDFITTALNNDDESRKLGDPIAQYRNVYFDKKSGLAPFTYKNYVSGSGSKKEIPTNIAFLQEALEIWKDGNETKEFFKEHFIVNKADGNKVRLFFGELKSSVDLLEVFFSDGPFDKLKDPTKMVVEKLFLFAVVISRVFPPGTTEQIETRKERLRRIRNLLTHTNNNNSLKFDKQHCTIIFQIMLNDDIGNIKTKNLGFSDPQIEHEQTKMELRKSLKQQEQKLLIELEDHILLRGCVSIITGSTKQDKHPSDLETYGHKFFLETYGHKFFLETYGHKFFLETYGHKFLILFDEDKEKDYREKFLKSFLSFEDYSVLDKLHSRLIKGKYTERYRLILGNYNYTSMNYCSLYMYFTNIKHQKDLRPKLRNFLAQFSGNRQEINNIFEDISKNFKEKAQATQSYDWRYYCIKYELLTKYAKDGHYLFKEDESKTLFPFRSLTSYTLKGYHADFYLACLNTLQSINYKISSHQSTNSDYTEKVNVTHPNKKGELELHSTAEAWMIDISKLGEDVRKYIEKGNERIKPNKTEEQDIIEGQYIIEVKVKTDKTSNVKDSQGDPVDILIDKEDRIQLICGILEELFEKCEDKPAKSENASSST